MQSPKLEVPETRTRERSGMSGFVFVLLLVVLVVQILSLFVSPSGQHAINIGGHTQQLSVEDIRNAALELERKNVSEEAAGLWSEYLDAARLNGVEEGNIRYRIGKNWQNSGKADRAYAQFVLAEILLGDSNPELKDEIGRRRRECLRDMGNFADLAREIAEQSQPDSTVDLEKEQVVAEIGSQKITVADFNRMLTDQIELAVKARPGMSQEEEQINRERYHKQLTDPQRREQTLQNMVVTRVLAEEARKQEIHRSPEFRERLSAMADSVLAQTLLFDEVSKRATVTDEDVKRFYEANKSRYEQPAASFIGHILCADEATARKVIQRIQGGESFDSIAKSESRDAGTRDKFGIIADPVAEDGDYVPGIGKNKTLHDAIRNAEASEVLPEPYESAKGWHVIKVVSHQTRLAQPFEEIADEVRRDTQAARSLEVSQQYLAELQTEYGVKLYPTALDAASEQDAKDETPQTP
ncbi:MAG: peptidyl-prolyl cis-trans isomerase [Phycisphaerales bacterium]|nr:peptidyl-prolyl cis-trans isomerase [Phycisphaerales bacterium]